MRRLARTINSALLLAFVVSTVPTVVDGSESVRELGDIWRSSTSSPYTLSAARATTGALLVLVCPLWTPGDVRRVEESCTLLRVQNDEVAATEEVFLGPFDTVPAPYVLVFQERTAVVYNRHVERDVSSDVELVVRWFGGAQTSFQTVTPDEAGSVTSFSVARLGRELAYIVWSDYRGSYWSASTFLHEGAERLHGRTLTGDGMLGPVSRLCPEGRRPCDYGFAGVDREGKPVALYAHSRKRTDDLKLVMPDQATYLLERGAKLFGICGTVATGDGRWHVTWIREDDGERTLVWRIVERDDPSKKRMFLETRARSCTAPMLLPGRGVMMVLTRPSDGSYLDRHSDIVALLGSTEMEPREIVIAREKLTDSVLAVARSDSTVDLLALEELGEDLVLRHWIVSFDERAGNPEDEGEVD